MAKLCGDRTAFALGRLSLNPLKHIDPFGTLVLPGLLLLMGSPFLFGWAKPVPVNPGRLRDPRWDMVKVAVAGPGANVVMAVIWVVIAMVTVKLHIGGTFSLWVVEMSRWGVMANIFLAAFNLLPLLPLDGGRVLANSLPAGSFRTSFEKLEPYGFFIVLGLSYLGLLRVPITAIALVIARIVSFVTGHG